MFNKAIIAILVLLLIICGGLFYYSYLLNEQINLLGGQLAYLQQEQTARTDEIADEITAFQNTTSDKLSALQDDIQLGIDDSLNKIGALENEVNSIYDRFRTTEKNIDGNLVKIDTLEGNVEQFTSEINQSVIRAADIYDSVKRATVIISNGEQTIGSGLIIDNIGHVATAEHVVNNLNVIYVILADGRISTATVIGSSPQSDISILKLDKEMNIEPLQLVDSNTIRIGSPVATVGHPFDLRDTLTRGIISQTGRFVEITGNSQTKWIANLIQFDAPVNSGNSGCPLVNTDGDVIGMVLARIEPDKGDGMYHAISSNMIMKVSESIIDKGFYDYPKEKA